MVHGFGCIRCFIFALDNTIYEYNVLHVISVICNGFCCFVLLTIFTFKVLVLNVIIVFLILKLYLQFEIILWFPNRVLRNQTDMTWDGYVERGKWGGGDLLWPNFVMTMHETGSSLMGLLSLYTSKISSLLKLSSVV